MDMKLMGAGFQVMVLGLGGVFFVLILFYLSTKIMLHISKKMQKSK
ncbi:MAG TPA: OadG family protein [Anaerovoracaceae bacterium]|nr:OadG family protein [Anaerovoracaceae bacterium]